LQGGLGGPPGGAELLRRLFAGCEAVVAEVLDQAGDLRRRRPAGRGRGGGGEEETQRHRDTEKRGKRIIKTIDCLHDSASSCCLLCVSVSLCLWFKSSYFFLCFCSALWRRYAWMNSSISPSSTLPTWAVCTSVRVSFTRVYGCMT